MKKFKPNKLTTFMFSILRTVIPLSFGFPIMYIIMDPDRYTAVELLGMIPITWLVLALIVILCCVLNLLTHPFTKHAVCLYEHHVLYRNTSVKYREVTRIEFDSGAIRRFGGSDPCCLDCYVGDELLVSIDHPSLLMTLFLISRCKTAKLRYRRTKDFLLTCALVLLMCIVLGICGMYGIEL